MNNNEFVTNDITQVWKMLRLLLDKNCDPADQILIRKEDEFFAIEWCRDDMGCFTFEETEMRFELTDKGRELLERMRANNEVL